MKIKKMLYLMVASGVLVLGVNASIAMASEGVNDNASEQSTNVEKNIDEKEICPITGNVVGSGKKNCEGKGQRKAQRDLDGDGLCDVTGKSIENNKKNCQNKNERKVQRDADGDGICDISGDTIGGNRKNCKGK